jgi:hypothetical protein
MRLWGHVKNKFQDILSKVTKKSGRSRLEPYGELIGELRGRGLTYRDLSEILTAELQFQVPKSTVNDFMRERARRRKNASRQMSRRAAIPAPVVPKAATLCAGHAPSDNEVRQRSQRSKLVSQPPHHPTMASSSTHPNRSASLIRGNRNQKSRSSRQRCDLFLPL